MSPLEPKLTAPKPPLPEGYRPAGGVPYKVTDRDSWSSLAKAHKVDVWWLIQYNFETRNPDEINWYLKHRTGCKRTTGGRNYKFSSADSPGIIHLPTDEMVRAQKNLKFKSYGITIEGGEDYRQAVEATLGRIAMSDTGMALLKAIQRTGKQIMVSPWTGTACNATARSTDRRAATPAHEPVLMGGNSFEQMKDPSMIRDLLGLPLEPVTGTGEGSGGVVNFTPSMFGFGATGACALFAGAPGASPSQVLFHELSHAYRYTRGKFYPRPTIAGSTGYTNMEEFFAVVLSNVLTSDPTFSTGNRTLRADHAGFSPLAAGLSTSRGFVTDVPNRNKMRELIADDPELVTGLKAVKSYFNPFTESL